MPQDRWKKSLVHDDLVCYCRNFPLVHLTLCFSILPLVMKLHPHLSTSEYELIITEIVKLPPPVLLSIATFIFILKCDVTPRTLFW